MADTSIPDATASIPRISPPQLRGHRTGDIAQAALAGLGPILFGFGNDPEAKYFYGQAATEIGVIGTTDWDAAGSRP